MPPREWAGHPVGKESRRPNWTNSDCVPFTDVSHVCHVDAAVSILKQGEIRAGLVYDESKLRTRRVCVSWFSPNYWHPGSRYGNVSFNFAWPDVTDGLDPFWVERIEYGIPAYRFLFSGRNRERIGLEPYDPEADRGPWAVRDEGHRRNDRVCLEVMVERSVELSESTGLSFVSHHATYCKIKPKDCEDCSRTASSGGAIFLARVVSEGIKVPKGLIRGDEATVAGAAEHLAASLVRTFEKNPEGVRSSHDLAPALARAVLAAYARRQFPDAKRLKQLFRTRDDLLGAVIAEFEALLGFGPKLHDE